jgi:hypothetical protein
VCACAPPPKAPGLWGACTPHEGWRVALGGGGGRLLPAARARAFAANPNTQTQPNTRAADQLCRVHARVPPHAHHALVWRDRLHARALRRPLRRVPCKRRRGRGAAGRCVRAARRGAALRPAGRRRRALRARLAADSEHTSLHARQGMRARLAPWPAHATPQDAPCCVPAPTAAPRLTTRVHAHAHRLRHQRANRHQRRT